MIDISLIFINFPIHRKLHFLICNAAVFGAPHEITEDGFEQTFQINYLAHVYLIQLLQDVLIASAPSRIILVSSENHRFSLLNKSNISEEYLSPKSANRFVSIIAYNDSKLCMNLITRYLAQMYQNYNVTVHCLHPGNAIYTNLQRNWWLYRLGFFLIRPFTKSVVSLLDVYPFHTMIDFLSTGTRSCNHNLLCCIERTGE